MDNRLKREWIYPLSAFLMPYRHFSVSVAETINQNPPPGSEKVLGAHALAFSNDILSSVPCWQ